MSCELFSVFLLIFVGEMINGDELNEDEITGPGPRDDILAAAISKFSQNLYQQVALQKENVIYSPLSIHLSLTLAWYGAREATAAQMADTLGLTLLSESRTLRADRKIIFEMNAASYVDVYISNAMFLKSEFPIEPNFIKVANENYFSKVSNFDLNTPGGAEKPVNDYVKDKSHGTIQEILPPGTIDGSTVLVLVNTLVFNATWESPFFYEEETAKQNFYKLNGVTSQVDMMRGTSDVRFKNDDQNGIDIVQLPLNNDRFGLTIVLPREVDGINKLESLLQSPNIVDEFFIGLKSTPVALSIPKFKIETELSLKEPLQELGIKNAFDQGLADFKGISTNEIYISQVLHKAVIEVQESGTVGVAVTGVNFGVRSLPAPTFTANHPFLFFLRDDEYKQIVFQGKFSG